MSAIPPENPDVLPDEPDTRGPLTRLLEACGQKPPAPIPEVKPITERVAKLAPLKSEGVRVDFDHEIPVTWIAKALAAYGIGLTRSMNTGHPKAYLTPEGRAKLEKLIAQNEPGEAARRALLKEGREP